MKSHSVPDYLWQVVATDLFPWDENDFHVFVDYYCRYFEVALVQSTASKTIIQHMKSPFSRYSIPEKIFFDNGPQFSSIEYAKFSVDYDIFTPHIQPKVPPIQWLSRINSSNSQMLEYWNTPIHT